MGIDFGALLFWSYVFPLLVFLTLVGLAIYISRFGRK